ncbi:unnamed protein product [Dovyalis caffra]|uniref:Uncharacterized protein n=1 Tax=Dovyalis caffra TaxID=77055 RepID=A0AAV1QYB5_9ROSI|nr:unnamed protein product [Dovyalis caffra]
MSKFLQRLGVILSLEVGPHSLSTFEQDEGFGRSGHKDALLTPGSYVSNASSTYNFGKLKFAGIVSKESKYGPSFLNLEYPSPLSKMPMWRMDEGISMPNIPNNLRLYDKDMHPRDAFSLLNDNDIKNTCSTRHDDLHKDLDLKMEILE